MRIDFDQPINTAMPCGALPPFRPPLALAGRERPTVLILDTGLSTLRSGAGPAHPYLRDSVVIHRDWRDDSDPTAVDDEDEADANRDRRLDLQSGHGTFVVGLVRRLCPDAVIHVDGVLSGLTTSDDEDIREGMARAVRRTGPRGPDIAVMTLTTYTEDDQPPPLARWIDAYLPNTLVVAAAGNAAATRPAYPAALPGVVAVGGLGASGRAPFSNYGGWVDACTPAVDVVSTFFTDFDERVNGGTRRYRGWARWSGTSFAAPKVAAVVAQHMYVHGRTAREAWADLADPRALRHPDLGVVFNLP
ncbi:MAG: S8 family serine peptidase [Ilumatobacteraceae bacterium]